MAGIAPHLLFKANTSPAVITVETRKGTTRIMFYWVKDKKEKPGFSMIFKFTRWLVSME
jgi:hypothetical protein